MVLVKFSNPISTIPGLGLARKDEAAVKDLPSLQDLQAHQRVEGLKVRAPDVFLRAFVQASGFRV